MPSFLRPVSRIVQIIFSLYLVYFAIRLISYHFCLVTFPYSSALREGAMMTSTDAMIKGLNPYAMALQPRFMNQYGIIYPLFVLPWAKLFGTTILVHRLVSAFFVLASCVLIYLVMARMGMPFLLNMWAVLMLYASLTYPGTSTPTIDPGACGLFIFLLTIFIPWFCKYSYKSLMIAAVLGILAFYDKPYFLLGAMIMMSYVFLFVSRMKGFFYGFLLSVLAVISIAAVNQWLPAYFDNCFFTSANMAFTWSSMERLHEQIVLYRALHRWIFILIGLFLLGYGFAMRQQLVGLIRDQLKEIWANLRFFNIHEPLIKLNFPLVLYAGICSSFVLYMSLGRHSGSMLWYFFQLLSPFLLISAVWLFSRNVFWPILCVPLLIYNLYMITVDHNYKFFDEHKSGWPEVTNLISHYQHILNSSLIAPLLIQENKDIVDDGQAEYFLYGGQRSHWMSGLFKEDDRIYVQQALFFENIRRKVEHQEYGIIILQPSLLPMGVAEEINKYYKCEGGFELYAPQDRRPYALTIWMPKSTSVL